MSSVAGRREDSVMGGPSSQPAGKFPYSIPQDSEVTISTELSKLVGLLTDNQDTVKLDAKDLFCQTCAFPMRVRVSQKPCEHNVCYACFELSPNDCKV